MGGGNRSGPVEVAATLTAKGQRIDFEVETFIAGPAHTLRGEGFDASEDGTGRGTPLVPVAFDARQSDVLIYGDMTGPLDTDGHSIAIGFSCKDHGADAGDEIAPTLRAMGHGDSHPNAGGQIAVAIHENQRGEITLNDTAGALKVGGGKPGQGYSAVMTGWAVRRLLPHECARLQGFPDHHSRIPWRGKPADLCPDGPQYKTYGNSFAVPVVRWIGERIKAAMSVNSESSDAA